MLTDSGFKKVSHVWKGLQIDLGDSSHSGPALLDPENALQRLRICNQMFLKEEPLR